MYSDICNSYKDCNSSYNASLAHQNRYDDRGSGSKRDDGSASNNDHYNDGLAECRTSRNDSHPSDSSSYRTAVAGSTCTPPAGYVWRATLRSQSTIALATGIAASWDTAAVQTGTV